MSLNMNEEPCKKLYEMLKQYGPDLCDDPKRCEALLQDLCGQYRGEISVLINAQRQGIVTELRSSLPNVPLEVLQGRLIKQLKNDLRMNEDAAKWAVESWAIALDKPIVKDINSTQNFSIPPPIKPGTTAPDNNNNKTHIHPSKSESESIPSEIIPATQTSSLIRLKVLVSMATLAAIGFAVWCTYLASENTDLLDANSELTSKNVELEEKRQRLQTAITNAVGASKRTIKINNNCASASASASANANANTISFTLRYLNSKDNWETETWNIKPEKLFFSPGIILQDINNQEIQLTSPVIFYYAREQSIFENPFVWKGEDYYMDDNDNYRPMNLKVLLPNEYDQYVLFLNCSRLLNPNRFKLVK
jgi:hypothetical protein